MPQNPSCCPGMFGTLIEHPKAATLCRVLRDKFQPNAAPCNNFTTVPHFRLTVTGVNTLGRYNLSCRNQ